MKIWWITEQFIHQTMGVRIQSSWDTTMRKNENYPNQTSYLRCLYSDSCCCCLKHMFILTSKSRHICWCSWRKKLYSYSPVCSCKKYLTRTLHYFGKNYLGICWDLNLGCEESLARTNYCYRRHCITKKILTESSQSMQFGTALFLQTFGAI